jgi:hypothetical protein
MTRGTSHPRVPKGESQRRARGRKRRRNAEKVALAQRAERVPVCVLPSPQTKTSFPLLLHLPLTLRCLVGRVLL